ncbi:hypothetical protein ACC699_13710 [Rhizobium ruizarguesonis]
MNNLIDNTRLAGAPENTMRVSELLQLLSVPREMLALKLELIRGLGKATQRTDLHREELEAHIEALISFLDVLDGDADIEPDNDNEPTLGAPEQHISQAHWYYPVSAEQADLEIEDENDEDGGDTEPNGDELDASFTEDDAGGFCQ